MDGSPSLYVEWLHSIRILIIDSCRSLVGPYGSKIKNFDYRIRIQPVYVVIDQHHVYLPHCVALFCCCSRVIMLKKVGTSRYQASFTSCSSVYGVYKHHHLPNKCDVSSASASYTLLLNQASQNVHF